jgi:hypothetical protein
MTSISCRGLFLCCLLATLALLFTPATAAPRSLNQPVSHILRRADTNSTEPIDCSTGFSGDYYGFGVRLGVYFTWLSSYFANIMLRSEIAGALDTNCIFLLALLISLFRGTITHGLYQIDALIVLHMSSGFLFSSLSVWGYRTLHYQVEGPYAIKHFGGWGTHIRAALVAAISVYGTWFWWEGLDDGLRIAQKEECRELWTWFFHTWNVHSGIGVYYIIACIGCSIYFCGMVVVSFLAWVLKVSRRGWVAGIKLKTGLNDRELVYSLTIY